jgi:hypothetical protein
MKQRIAKILPALLAFLIMAGAVASSAHAAVRFQPTNEYQGGAAEYPSQPPKFAEWAAALTAAANAAAAAAAAWAAWAANAAAQAAEESSQTIILPPGLEHPTSAKAIKEQRAQLAAAFDS